MKKLSNFLILLILLYAVGATGQCSVSITNSMNVVCFGEATGTATATGSGGTSPYEYLWDVAAGSQTGNTATGLAAGVYCVTVTDFIGCSANTCVTITQSSLLTINTSGSTNPTCQGFSNGSVTALASGGVPFYTYIWDTPYTTGLPAGEYCVTAVDNNGCTAESCVTLTSTPFNANAAVASNYNGSQVSCFGASDGCARAIPSGGTLPYTFNWNTGATNDTICNLGAGNYAVTITDASGCTAIASTTIANPPVLTATINPASVIQVNCFGASTGAIMVTASGGTPLIGYNYLWNTMPMQTTTTATGLSAGNYCVTVTDANGCTASTCATITQPSAPITINMVNTPASCNGLSNGTLTANVTGGVPRFPNVYSYAWSGSTQTPATITGLAAGVYCVTATDSVGCAATACATVTQPNAITATIISVTNVSCFGGSNGTAAVAGSGGTGGYSFVWTNGQTTATGTGFAANVTNCVTVTDANGCYASTCITLTQPATSISASTAIASIYNGSNVSCFGASDGSVRAIPSGGTLGYVYAWSPITVNNDTLYNIGIGTYTVTVTDANGCTATSSVNLTQPTAVTATISSSTNVLCQGGTNGTATAVGSGGTVVTVYDFLWANGQTSATATGLSAGVHCVTVTDVNGCSASACVIITQPATAVNVTASVTSNYNGAPISCNGASDGTAMAVASGGFGGVYNFVWTNGTTTSSASSSTINSLIAGVYCATATDMNGCNASSCITITQPNALSVNIIAYPSYCPAVPGVMQSNYSGGTPPLNYLWTGGHTTQNVTGLAAGTYCLTVTDANNCSVTSIPLCDNIYDIIPSVSINLISNPSCNGLSNGSAIANPVDLMGPYTYSWSNGSTVANPTNLDAGVHCVTVTSLGNGACVVTNCITITEPSAITATISNSTNVLCFGGSTGTAIATASGGTPNYTYNWNNGNAIPNITGLPAGLHCVTVTDGNGCSASDCVTITEPATAVNVTATVTSNYNGASISCNGNFDGAATAVGSGGTGAYSFQWDGLTGLQTTPTATNLGANISYCVTVSDANGCIATDCVTLSQPSAVTATITNITNVSCFGGSDGSATVSASGGVGGYNYLWFDGTISPTLIGLPAGSPYPVTVTDNNGCEASISASITQPPALTLSFSAPDTICSGTTTTITVTPMGGVPAYNYIWYDASLLSSLPNAGAGNHCVTVTDINGCTISACKQINTLNFNPSIQDNWSGENPRIFLGDIYNIQTQNTHPNTIYNWTPAAGLSCSNCPNPIAAPSITTTYQLTATHLTTGCVSMDDITIEVFTPNTSHVYIDVAPDSTVQENYSHPLWTNGSMFNTAIHYPFVGNYGIASLDTNAHQFIYTSNGTVPQVIDTFIVLICNQICDTTYFYVTTASCVWPGDTDDDGIANNMDLLPIGLHHGAVGTTRQNANNTYTCQPARNWNIGTSGNPTVDIKHIDSDGNGTINDLDTNAIVLNWSQTHIKSISTTTTGIELYIDTATTSPGDTVTLPIILGDAQNPTAGYGVAFTINYDVDGVDTNSVSIDYNNSWLGTIGNNMIGISKDFYPSGQVQVAMTRTNHTSVMGGGTIGYIHFTIKDDVLPKSAFVRLDFDITDIRFIDHLGDTINTIGVPSQILVVDGPLGNSTIENSKNEIHVFPNPTGNLLNVQSLNEEIEMIQIMDMTGKLLLEETNIQNLQTSLNMNALPSGMYVLNIQTSSKMQQVKVLKK